MNLIDFSILFKKDGGYSLPVLIELNNPDKAISWYFTNNKQDITWNNKLYKSAVMSYKFPSSTNGIPSGGSLEIDIDIQKDDGYELLAWFDEADDKTNILVVGLINEQGDIRPLSQLAQRFGTVTWNGKTITWNLGQDDKLQMQINPWVADNDFLTG
jgi:hypothetical protein